MPYLPTTIALQSWDIEGTAMNFSKKDEDVEQAILKVDRTSVFQEGEGPHPSSIPSCD